MFWIHFSSLHLKFKQLKNRVKCLFSLLHHTCTHINCASIYSLHHFWGDTLLRRFTSYLRNQVIKLQFDFLVRLNPILLQAFKCTWCLSYHTISLCQILIDDELWSAIWIEISKNAVSSLDRTHIIILE